MGKLESLAAALLGTLDEAKIPAALAGGMAANAWVETEDVHLTYDVDAAVLIPEGLTFSPDDIADGIAARSGTPKAKIVRIVTAPEGTMIDLVLADPAYSATAIGRAGLIELGGVRRAVLAPEDVILYKSLAARDKDRIAISAIAKAQKLDRAYLEKWSRHLGTWEFLCSVLP